MNLIKTRTSLEAPIGVFDSGLGGLTVVREIRKQLPHEQLIYFGDVARLPYGIKSEQQILRFSRENAEFLLGRQVKALVVACNSSSSVAYSYLKKRFQIPVVDVIQPAAGEAVAVTRNKRVGVIGTRATIASGAYEESLKRLDAGVKVFSEACPLLVPFVEEGVVNGRTVEAVLGRYLKPLLRRRIDTLVLGCTHYPMLREAIRKAAGPQVRLVDSAPAAVRILKHELIRLNLLCRRKHRGRRLRLYVSDLPKNFVPMGTRFLGESMGRVNVVRFSGQVQENGKWTL